MTRQERNGKRKAKSPTDFDGVWKVPSPEWVALQFLPADPSRVGKHTGRFPVRMMVQKRTLRKANVDSCYVFYLWFLCKTWLVKLRDAIDEYENHTGDAKVLAFSLDDKSNIPIGAPGQPRRPGVNGNRRAPTPANKPRVASDHDDCGKEKVTPSVTLKVDIPATVDGSWYRGKVFVKLKLRSVQPSSPLRHIVELLRIIRHLGLEAAVECIHMHSNSTYFCWQEKCVCV